MNTSLILKWASCFNKLAHGHAYDSRCGCPDCIEHEYMLHHEMEKAKKREKEMKHHVHEPLSLDMLVKDKVAVPAQFNYKLAHNLPKSFDWMTLDTIAETMPVSKALYSKLWHLTGESEEEGTAQPLGGDGSEGTTEEPIVGGNYSNVLAHAWHKFTPEEQAELLEVFKKEEKEMALIMGDE